jgi:hypothetical protein
MRRQYVDTPGSMRKGTLAIFVGIGGLCWYLLAWPWLHGVESRIAFEQKTEPGQSVYFKLCVDGDCQRVPPSEVRTTGETYTILRNLKPGTHKIGVQACESNGDLCSPSTETVSRVWPRWTGLGWK